jgi:flagellar basal body-associated protein FliL
MTVVVILLIVLVVALLGGLAFVMSRASKLEPHRRRDGRPAARMRARFRRGPNDRL